MDFLNPSKLKKILKFSADTPSEGIPMDFPTQKTSEDFTLESIDDEKIHRANTSESELAQTKNSLIEKLQGFSIEKDDSYKFLEVQQQESALTKSLKERIDTKCFVIYLFESKDFLTVFSDLNVSTAHFLQLTENAYKKSEYFLKYRLEGPFKLYFRQQFSFSADYRRNLNQNSTLKDLDTKTFVLIKEENKVLKIWFKGKSIEFECRNFEIVSDLFNYLNPHFFNSYKNLTKFEFVGKMNESDYSVVPIDSPISQLTTRELYLRKKRHDGQPTNRTNNKFAVYSFDKNGKEKSREMEINRIHVLINRKSKFLNIKKKEREILRKELKGVMRDLQDPSIFFIEYKKKQKAEILKYKCSNPLDTEEIILSLI